MKELKEIVRNLMPVLWWILLYNGMILSFIVLSLWLSDGNPLSFIGLLFLKTGLPKIDQLNEDKE